MPELNSAAPGFAAARQLATVLHGHHHRCVMVGGAVRDLLMGRQPDDFDLLTTARPEELIRIFPEAKLVGASFGVTIIRCDGIDIEVATARKERFYLDGRHPGEVSYTDDLSQDAARRDFTVNALMYDFSTGEILDHTGGLKDLEAGILRAVGDPETRFKEDYLRLLRAVRFASKLNFALDTDLERAMKKQAGLTGKLSAERIFSELDMILTGRNPERAFRLLESSGILQVILPEVARLRQISQPPQFHPEGDVLEHTLLMLRHMALPSRRLAWSVLLHDVGKAVTRTVDADGRIRFFGHEDKGTTIAGEILRRLRFSNSDLESCMHAIRNHMRFASVVNMKKSTLRKLLGEADFAMELELHRLDCLACHGIMTGFNFLLDRIAELDGETAMPEPLLKGRDLVAAGIKPQARFKPILDRIYEAQLAGEYTSTAEALQAALKLFE